MRSVHLALLTFALSPFVLAAQQVSANFLISKTPTKVSLSDWETSDSRGTLATDVQNATLRGYIYEGRNPAAPTLLFFNDENTLIRDGDVLYRSLSALGPTVIVYDYRGLGYSTGKPDVAQSRYDALALYDAVKASIRPDHPIVVYGFSMGSAMAAFVASQRNTPPNAPAAVILAAPMASAVVELDIYARLLGNQLSGSSASPNAVQVLDAPALLERSQAPLLVLQSTSDIIVPYAEGKRVFTASPSPSKQMVDLPNIPHGETPRCPAALRAVKQLFRSVARQ